MLAWILRSYPETPVLHSPHFLLRAYIVFYIKPGQLGKLCTEGWAIVNVNFWVENRRILLRLQMISS